MNEISIEKLKTAEDKRQLSLSYEYVVHRGYKPGNIVACGNTQGALIGEAALIALKESFTGAVMRSPEAVFQSSFRHLVVGFEKPEDAQRYRDMVDKILKIAKAP